ncbi:MAG: hypothetical protein OXC13_15880 [Caldilineaceae bacterium]|nr:hypothetical protein [Caldilineaceae bacterium]
MTDKPQFQASRRALDGLVDVCYVRLDDRPMGFLQRYNRGDSRFRSTWYWHSTETTPLWVSHALRDADGYGRVLRDAKALVRTRLAEARRPEPQTDIE